MLFMYKTVLLLAILQAVFERACYESNESFLLV